MRSRGGFTLVETLVALLVLGLVGAAAIALVGQNLRAAASVENRLYASILADNAMVDALARDGALERGETDEAAELAGRKWTIVRTVSDAPVAGLARIDVAVRLEGGAQTFARATTLRREKAAGP